MLYFSSNSYGNNDPEFGRFYCGLALKEVLVVFMEVNATAYNPFAAFGLTLITINNKIYFAFI
ncbi:hypothetical protein IFR04_013457 [Cadophora malorum]|uniref:Uncharacterized protein n=1 Tax=Cadophora malorum TaxID=108018 RepID=A0A8H7W5U0_9HELO|nr:hypothetical protein IFR04_013457 [Cadophora malorum]